MLRNNRNILWIFLAFWLVINLLQAGLTGLFHDEAYYYFYSRHLAWGYYDHPPFIALLIRSGYAIFHNELGVRLFYVILSLASILILYHLSEVKKPILFISIFSSFLVFQVTGFMALPDSPLLFFTALFFLVYKKYSEEYSLVNAIWLALVMALMFYSKYLGIFIVFFTVVSNPALLLKRSFWLSVIITTILYIPHLLWQYQHDFPSFYYHLVERSHDEMFRWSNFGEYIVGQAGQINPILFIPVVYLLIIFKPENLYDRALKYAAAGSLLLPFLMMLKGRVEANWTMAGLIPLFLIVYRMSETRPKMHRFYFISGIITLIIVLSIRILLIYNYLPEQLTRKARLDVQGWKPFTEKLAELADDRPVVFNGSYQGPSQYIFHTGKEAFSFNNSLYRGNQFDLEGIEEKLQGKEVMLLFPRRSVSAEDLKEYGIELNDSIQIPNGKYRCYYYEKNYRSYNFLPAEVPFSSYTFKAGEEIEIPVILKNPGTQPVDFREAAPAKVFLTNYLFKYGKILIYNKFEDISTLILKDEYHTSFRMKMPEEPGTYYIKVSVKSGWLPAGLNSRLVKIKVR